MNKQHSDKIENQKNVKTFSPWDITNKVPKGFINFTISEPNFPTPAAIRNEAQGIVLSEDLSYSATPGLDELRELIASHFNYGYEADGVTITSGASEALYSILFTLLKKGDEVLIPSIGNPNYHSVCKLTSATIKKYTVNPYEKVLVRSENLESLVTDKTKCIIINSPMDPTGQVITQEELTALSNICQDKGVYIILDNTYYEIIYGNRLLNFKALNDNVIIFSSLSKVFSLTGWRIGWILANPKITQSINKLRNLISTCAPTISQRLAIRIYKGVGRESFDKILSILSNRRKLMIETFRNQKLDKFCDPNGGYYLFMNYNEFLDQKMPSREFATLLADRKSIAVIPGAVFGKDGEGFIRVSFATEEQSIQQGVAKIRELIDELNTK